MTNTSRKGTLEQVLCIQYLVQFRWKYNKDKDKDVKALIDSGSEVNVMHLTYATKLGLCTKKVDVGLQKINGFYLDIFRIVIADCMVKNKFRKIYFF